MFKEEPIKGRNRNQKNKLMPQIKNSFDKATLVKIGKGALIAASATFALYILDWLGTIEVGVATPLIAALVPILVNTIKEWRKGEAV